jgi:uncharacterized phage protein gp47/JayE
MTKSFSQLSPEAELTYNLLAPDQLYPWNPADPEAEEYYQLQAEQFNLDDWSETDIQQSATAFFTQLQHCWPDASIDLLGQLRQHFNVRIPQEWLEKIAATVQVARQPALAANQLVSCVQELLPSWEEADLLVLARPYSYAMRCDLAAENVNSLVRAADWQDLSEMEQAKLTMLATKYALDQLADQSCN